MKHLVIAEKPSVGRDIARVLDCRKKTNTYIEGNEYVVTWALGHLVTLADPEEYGEKYKSWNMDTLPMIPNPWKLVVIKQTSRQYHAVKEQIFRKDISDIIIATDAGREGELVARWILEKCGNKKPVKRLWISSVTDKAIKEGFAHLLPGKSYENLYHAAVARAQADWVVGINATRALTCKYNAQLSCGRVQTPTLSMIAAREDEIRNFISQKYYGIQARTNGLTFTWTDKKSGSARTFNKERAEKICCPANKTQSSMFLTITDLKKKHKKTFSPALYDLTTLQLEANQKYGFSAKETLNIMQRLYEFHKVLTYPRTDSRFLTSDIVGTLPERLKACAMGPYRKTAARLSVQKIEPSPAFVNNAKVSDHHAIIPTEQFVQPEKMSNEERKIYDMVIRRFLAVLSPACEYDEITVSASLNGESFHASGRLIRCEGWKAIFSDESDASDSSEINTLSHLKPGMQLEISSINITEGKTTPPARFTEGSLIAAMENPMKYMETKDSSLIRTLGETGGLGTVATRADIIEKLFGSFLMEKKGSEICITSKGRQLLSLVPNELKSPELTAQWELKLKGIAQGQLDSQEFMAQINRYTKTLINEIKNSAGTFRHDNITRTKCPQCGKLMLEVKGKHGRLLVCQDRECGYRETISRTTNARCPVCHKKMELTGKKDAQKFICSCGYKEKLSVFQERKKKEGTRANKKDVANYLKKQAKEAEAPINNSFAEALKNLGL